MFAAFAAHPSLGWFSQYMHRFPQLKGLAALSRLPEIWPGSRAGVARSGESWSIVNRLQIAPSESAGDEYGVWTHCCGKKLHLSFLLGVKPTEAERQCLHEKVSTALRFQKKDRFAAKLTGPPRIGYLSTAFEDAIFIHVIRDPRAVVGSLMRVPFWRDTFRYSEPAWSDGLSEQDLQAWRADGESPTALAALEWRTVLGWARKEAAEFAPGRYMEVRYEDFIADPHHVLGMTFDFSQLPPNDRPYRFVDKRVGIQDLTDSWKKRLSDDEVRIIESITSSVMRELDYASAAS